MSKYYIANNFHFIQGFGNTVKSPASATHFSYQDAKRYVGTHPDHIMIPIKKSKKKTAYFVSTPQLFLSGDNKVVSCINDAMSFTTIKGAFDKLDSLGAINKSFTEPCVIDDKYNRVPRSAITPQIKKLTPDNTGRIMFTPSTKRIIYENNSHICGICGKLIPTIDEMNIDHIIPLSRGGTNDIENLRPTHKFCNRLKNNFTDSEMEEIVGDIACQMALTNPSSDITNRMIRLLVRSTIYGYGK